MNPNAFQNVQLKKVNREPTISATSTLQSVVDGEKELFRRLLEADMDSWYDALKDHTYPTVFLPLAIEEAEAMIAKYTGKGTQRFCTNTTSPSPSSFPCSSIPPLPLSITLTQFQVLKK
jgi:hypothetical protein